jgi:hypothetical protein
MTLCKICNQPLKEDGTCRKVYTAVQAFKEGLSAANHPSHYGGNTPHEVIKCLEAWGLERDALLWNGRKVHRPRR